MKPLLCWIYRDALCLITMLERWVRPLFDLLLRLYLWQVFFRAGWLKLSDWSATQALFDYVYHVPLLPPQLAAVMGTAGELGLSCLLLLGLAGRFAAAGLFVTNLVAVLSFADISVLGIKDHILWGTLLAILALHGTGKWSLDSWINHRLKSRCK